MAVDGNGNVFVADQGTSLVSEIATTSVSFGAQAAGSSSATQLLAFAITADTTVGSINIVTQGATGLDFRDGGSSTCAATTYSSATNCVVSVTFTPKYAGLRQGAAVIRDGSGNVLASVPIYGIGTGPQAWFLPGTKSAVSTTVSQPGGVAVDAAGNVYITEYLNGVVLKETYSGGTYTATTIASSTDGLANPSGIAVDGAGNLFFADNTNNNVYEASPSGGSYTVSTVVTGLDGPSGVAVDATGNLYVASSQSGQVFKETPSAGAYSQSVVADTSKGLEDPAGVAVDGSGNVFITDGGTNRVYKETLSSSGYTQSVVVSGLSEPGGIAVSGTGRLFISDTGHGPRPHRGAGRSRWVSLDDNRRQRQRPGGTPGDCR